VCERERERVSSGNEGENSINCLARHKIMLHYRLARLRQKPPNVALGSALRCRDKDSSNNRRKRQNDSRQTDTDTDTYDIRQVPQCPCSPTLYPIYASEFPSVFSSFFPAGNSNCRWADETMTIETAMKLPMVVETEWA